MTLDESNTWTATIDDLPVYADGEEIVYSWTEETPDGYTLSAETDGDITTLTNTHTPETKDLVVNKVWDDNNNQDGIRPDHIDVSLYGNEEFIGELTLDLNGEWSGTIAGQFVYENGEEMNLACIAIKSKRHWQTARLMTESPSMTVVPTCVIWTCMWTVLRRSTAMFV